MNRPGEITEIQLVAILRVLKITQEETGSILKMRKERVGDIENWLKAAHFESVEGLFLNYRLQKVIEERLSDTDILPADLVRAARLTSEDILEHYRKDYPKDAKRPRKDVDAWTSKLYEEHQNGMINLVRRLDSELALSLSECWLGSRKSTELHSRPKRVTVIVNSLSGANSLCYPLEVEENPGTQILYGYLKQHLCSSPHSWVGENTMRGIPKWQLVGGEELRQRTRFMLRIDREVERLTGKTLGGQDSIDYVGPSTWFSESIWAAVLDGLYRFLDYKVIPINSELFKSQYGARFIGLTATIEKGEQYVEWHKQLMAQFERSRTVRAINLLKKERKLLAKGIREVLTKFVVDKHVPGRCDYEFCR